MGEITDDTLSQIPGHMFRNRVLVCDRMGKDNIPVQFYHHDSDRKSRAKAKEFDFTSLRKGHTLFILQAVRHHYKDGTIGFRIEDLSTVFTVPCNMKDVLAISSLYYNYNGQKCWTCGKEKAVSAPNEQATQTSQDDVTLKKCGKCMVARYCCKECQVKDWKQCHRKWCRAIPHFMKLTKL